MKTLKHLLTTTFLNSGLLLMISCFMACEKTEVAGCDEDPVGMACFQNGTSESLYLVPSEYGEHFNLLPGVRSCRSLPAGTYRYAAISKSKDTLTGEPVVVVWSGEVVVEPCEEVEIVITSKLGI